MKIFKNTLTVILILCVFGAKSQSLENYLIEAAENNPGLKSSYFEFEAALQKTAQVKALPDPTLSFGYFVSPVETRVGPQKAKFSLVQMFPWFGTNGAKADVSEFNAQAKYQDFLDRKNELYLQVKQAYYPIFELQEQIKWQKENLEILKTYKRLSTTNFSNNKGSMVDVIRVDIMIDNANTDIQLLEDQLMPLETRFNRLLNRADTTPVIVQEDIEIDLDENPFSQDSILANNPILQSIELRMLGAQAMEETAKKQGLPSFGVGLDYAIVDKRTDMDVPENGKNVFMPMVTMSLPLFRNKYDASIKEAQFTQSALNQKKLDIENRLVSTFQNENYELAKSVQLIELYDQQIVKTKQAIDLLYSAYANSGKEFEEVLRMEQQLLKYKTSRASAIKDYHIAEAKLDYITAKNK